MQQHLHPNQHLHQRQRLQLQGLQLQSQRAQQVVSLSHHNLLQDGKVLASPAVRRRAREAGIDLTAVQGVAKKVGF